MLGSFVGGSRLYPNLRRRPIADEDLDEVAVLLASGFPRHGIDWWRRGLERMRRRPSPPDQPRYGRLLQCGDRIVGVLLTIHGRIPGAVDGPSLRRNLSSWYVEPAFAAQAPLLLGATARDARVTTINISPAAHTEPIIAAQGFRPFAAGSLATIPILARRREAARVRHFAPELDAGRWPDGALLTDHAALGCLCLVAEADDGPHPFVFSAVRRLYRLVPAVHLLYCRDIEAYVRFAAQLGAALAARGIPIVALDGPARLPGLPGRRFNLRQKKYVVGPHPPRPGDLAYTELAVFH